jgi:steroid 5-alpha reductase family enzyme
MIGDVAVRVVEAWLLCAVVQAALWMIAERTKNAGIVDVGWAQSFTAVVLLFAVQPLAPKASWLPIAVLVIAWSTRLTCYLVSRGSATGPEEGRYVELRRRWALRASRRFFGFFQVQAALTAVLSTAFVVPFVVEPWDGGWLRAIGFVIAGAGVAGEAIADAQLARWKRDPSHVGKVCENGLWQYSRHPNYFFEWCYWIGLAVYGIAFAPWGLVALAPQAIILGSIWGVTGIPPTETQALRSKGEAYREYQKRVSKFIPMPPKRARPMT